MGLEPTTPCMPCKCSSQLSYIPIEGRKGSKISPKIKALCLCASVVNFFVLHSHFIFFFFPPSSPHMNNSYQQERRQDRQRSLVKWTMVALLAGGFITIANAGWIPAAFAPASGVAVGAACCMLYNIL